MKQPLQRGLSFEFRPKMVVELQSDIGIFCRIGCRLFEVYLGKRDLVFAFARHLLKFDGFPAQMFKGQRVHVMASRCAIKQIGLKHGIESNPL